MVILPVPSFTQTRATAFFRRPVAYERPCASVSFSRICAGTWTPPVFGVAFFSSANDESSVAMLADPRILAVHRGDIVLLGLLRLVLVVGALVDAQVLHLRATVRAPG